ncbi:flagellar biosynthetic protein FliR [Fontisphaera persica]|uniref:flagellar biosynthetic protein FliR n=1 Tax=Fontisphaera persica TaxID=2974023 RepID=UPI0024BF2777|nr:flagellar biosynthetic protein FliR [Fontisphaera persica]WCJ58215.1 flagellar biosynthetic protein FliR [Fontisphaera persica]
MAEWLIAWMSVFVRAGALLTVFPVFAGRNFPRPLRVGLAALMGLLIAPMVVVPAGVGQHLGSVVLLLLAEMAAGLLMGFTCRMVFFAIEIAGGIITHEMALNMAASFNPLSEQRAEAPTMILYYLGAVLFFALDMHHWMLAAFQQSYQVLPAGLIKPGEPLLRHVLGHSSRIFLLALQMAAPVLAIAFLITLLFTILGRALPQMNVLTDSFPIRILAGLAGFGLTLSIMAQHVLNYLRRLPEDLLRVAQLLGLGG